MKLICSVKVSNRLVSGDSLKNKAVRTCLTISRNSVKDNELYIFLQTIQNKTGTKYKINGNIEKVYNQYMDEGKTTIRFKQPPHDIIIQSEVIQLKSFLHVLKLGLEKKANLSILPISNINPKNVNAILSKSQTKIIIKEKSQYPVLKGFPRTCEELHLVGLNRCSFDRQILNLQNLRILNLSNNNLTHLPKEFDTFKNLQELIVSENQLGLAPLKKWAWINCENLAKSLKLLDLRGNQISVLPHDIGKLHSLRNLNVSSNKLRLLPQSLAQVSRLEVLDVSKNQLLYFPGSMRNAKLETLDISDNNFQIVGDYSGRNTFDIPSLVEIAARAVIQSRKHYNASMIPLTLVSYLDHARYCVCGGPCFECSVHLLVLLDMSSIAHSVRSSANQTMPFDCYFCSPSCLRRYAPRAVLG